MTSEPSSDPFVLVDRVVNPYLVSFHDPDGFRAEQVRALRNKLLAMNPDRAARTLVVTSAIQGEGKTVTALNLGMALAELEQTRVVVLDFDLRQPNVESFLGLNPGIGLTELLEGHLGLAEVIRPSGVPGLDIIGAGQRRAHIAELYGSRRVEELLARLKEDYNYILLDTAPVIPVTDACVLSARCDGTLLVVGLEKSPRKLVRKALKDLEEIGGNVLGTFVTGIRGADPSADKRYRYYTKVD